MVVYPAPKHPTFSTLKNEMLGLPTVDETSETMIDAELSTVVKPAGQRLTLNLNRMAAGEQKLEGQDFLTTARSQNEVAITVRGDSKVKAKRIMQLLPAAIGKGRVKAAWRSCGEGRRCSSQLATASTKVSVAVLLQ